MLTSPPDQKQRLWQEIAAAALVVGVAAAPYLSTLSAYFSCDDFLLIQHFSSQPPWHFVTLFTRAWTDFIFGFQQDELRPLLALSYQWDALWGTTSPVPYRVTNILLHAVTSLLVFAIARYVMHLPRAGALFSGAVFAVLPTNVETVAWISGRADSQPAIAYLTTFLLYALWRQTGHRGLFVLSVAAFLLTLYSKQHAITMPATLLLYDLLVERRPMRLDRKFVLPYVPFVLMTFSYLALRLVLFGNVVREQQLGASLIVEFLLFQATYVQMLLTGNQALRTELPLALLAAALLPLFGGAVFIETLRASVSPRSPRTGIVFFGAAWWCIQIAPLMVTYLSARHLYLPAVGYAVVLGLAFSALWQRSGTASKLAAGSLMAVIIAVQLALLAPLVEGWNRDAALSETMVKDTQREMAAAAPGSLVVLGAPALGDDPNNFTWIWAFAVPAVLQPPWSHQDLSADVALVSSPASYCCPRPQWERDTRHAIRSWTERPDQPPVMVLDWDHRTHQLSKRTESDAPGLRAAVLRIAEAQDAAAMQRELEELAPGAATGRRYAQLRP